MKRKRLISLLVLLAAVVTGAWAQPWTSGDCTVTLSEGVMTVSGTGAMDNYFNPNSIPWYGSDIKTIVIESGVTGIGVYAFASSYNLESVSIPASVTSIGARAFEDGGSNVEALTVSFAEGSTPLTIGESAFADSNLKFIDIPNRVTSIGRSAFASCSNLESVSIPASVTSIDEGAFSYCYLLTKVYIFAPSLTTYGADAFDDNAAGRKIYVLPEAVDTYKAGWPAYAADIEAMTVYATSVKEGTEDAENWSATPSRAMEGQTVTITYAGTKSVKSVTAKRKTTTGNITVYFTDSKNWGDVHVYYWNDGTDWPGTPMTEVGTNEYSQKIYRAEIPATAVGVIFNGNGKQTADITTNIADGSWWYATDNVNGLNQNEAGYVGKWYEVKNVDDNKWTFTMPDGDMELDIEYNVAYPVTISDGDVDAANWSAPTEQSVGQNVTLQYTGKKKIKRITIVAASVPDPTPTLSLTSPAVGQVIGSDGKNYAADATLPTGVTKVAIIAHLNGSNGLAIALADESGNMNWETAVSTAAAHTPAFTGGTWKLPTKDEWKQMFSANGGNEDSCSGLNTALAAVGGDSSKLLESGIYWSSTLYDENNAWRVDLFYGNGEWDYGSVGYNRHVRACLAF